MPNIIDMIIWRKKGFQEGTGNVVITGEITCTDDGEGNVTITESESEG